MHYFEQDAADWGAHNEGLGGEDVRLDAQEGVYYGHAQRPAEMVRLRAAHFFCKKKKCALAVMRSKISSSKLIYISYILVYVCKLCVILGMLVNSSYY